MLMKFRDAADAEGGGCVAVDERRSGMAFFLKVDARASSEALLSVDAVRRSRGCGICCVRQ